jgi:hypothetical protein
MTIPNWQYDDLKNRLSDLIKDESTLHRDVLFECSLHFQRFEKWMARLQDAYWHEENECKHRGRLLDQIKRLANERWSNDHN